MEKYIEFKGNITDDSNFESVIESISKLSGVVHIERGFLKRPNWNGERGKASIKVKGDFDPCAIYSIITDAGYIITKIEKQRFD
jgi:hypothetical protein